ncbi:sodium:proton antiporter NhaD [Maribacter sp. ACAM166]|uniref:sodium:proton antiporter NhaD n=1 Tax=Maribacter sp. ACAM166 TaxID=2508996 RepID=UPI0010FE1E6A|nr:sodium:proton antiporter NhaD [Maribacter sp. ACAM166]TLP77009.1 sodium:proton antiporter [Maribacter sp. ACAM166]
MYLTLLAVFIVGYVFIALEHNVKVDKAATALLTGTLCWVVFIFGRDSFLTDIPGEDSISFVTESLRENLGEISEILFFLLGAMTIVEIIDAHEGFSVITDKITTTNRVKLLWILCVLTFFLSAALDNLTTAIVMSALLRKLIHEKKDLWMFAGLLIIAANAGGAWSPIGDVTTIMLWIGGQITALHIIKEIFLPSLVCLLVPLVITSFRFKGDISKIPEQYTIVSHHVQISTFEKNVVFAIGIGALLFVPIFKTITHLPPFMGILLGLSVVWISTELMHRNKTLEEKKMLSISNVLRRIDTPSILFFLGILVAVGALQSAGHLADMSRLLDSNFDSIYVVNAIIGVLSSIVDNVPLVAGTMGMYSLETYPVDSDFWELLAFCAGTGGSILIIGSAAGVAIMGILKIDFMWYLKHISLLAIIGYAAGILTFMLIN